eukprot:TRINITY_DN54666_c0_g1_i1.p1 TRINITY_DN54666_c0_g1~~TRINITY_DN54666_c0_g1_i1.p1  ORF type:complete len:204 (+),score=33.38 TRINITY_DN54666_c0_g1_i1:55-666(+)
MPVICIGPVCIPWSCLPAIVFFFWKFVKPVLPASWAAGVERFGNRVSSVCAPYLEKVPGFGKKPKKSAPVNRSPDATFVGGEIVQLGSMEQLDALLARSTAEGFAVILDFTAVWCRPCQTMKPCFQASAADYPTHCFVEVDVDVEGLDVVQQRCNVEALPAFHVFRGTECVDFQRGAGEDRLSNLLEKNLGARQATGEKKKGQ